jgi:hypothetical protein
MTLTKIQSLIVRAQVDPPALPVFNRAVIIMTAGTTMRGLE